MARKTTTVIFFSIALCAISFSSNSQILTKRSYAGELIIDSLTVGKTPICVYGKCAPVTVGAIMNLLINNVVRVRDTIYKMGTNSFALRVDNLSPGTDYYVSIVMYNSYGSDTVDFGMVTTLSDLGQSSNLFKIHNTLCTRVAGTTKVEVRGIISLPQSSIAVARCAIYSDSLCKKIIGDSSTALNYANNHPFQYMYDLYYDFNIDTMYYSHVYGKFWGHDNKNHSSYDSVPIRITVLPKKQTSGFGDEIFIRENFQITPNPAIDYLFLPFSVDYIVTDMMGRRLKDGTDDYIDVRDLPNGAYLLNVEKNNYQLFFHFTKN